MSWKSRVGSAFAILTILAGPALGQEWPTKPIRMINGFAAGGNADVVARIVAQPLGERLGQPIVVEAKPGAGTLIANAYVAGAEPDGYTLLVASSAFVTVAATSKQVTYDAVDGFAWTSMAISYPFVVSVHPASPDKSIADLVAHAKAKPKGLNYPSPGVGSALHLATELFSSMAGVEMVHVPFRGGNEPMLNLIAGRMDLSFETLTFATEHIKAGSVRPLAVTSRERAPTLPDVPTVAATVPGFEAISFIGFAAPKGTPKPIVDRINAEIRNVVSTPEIKARFADLGGAPWPTTSEEMRAHVSREIDKWKRVVAERGIAIN